MMTASDFSSSGLQGKRGYFLIELLISAVILIAGILFVLEDSAEQHLARFDLASGAVDRPLEGRLSLDDFVRGASGDIVARISMPELPPELFLLDGEDLSQLTRPNAALIEELEPACLDAR